MMIEMRTEKRLGAGVLGGAGAMGSQTRQLCPLTVEALQGCVCDTVREKHKCAHMHTHTCTNTHTWGFNCISLRTQCHSQQGPCPRKAGGWWCRLGIHPLLPHGRATCPPQGSPVLGPVKVKVAHSCPPKGHQSSAASATPRLTAAASAPLHPSPTSLSSRGSDRCCCRPRPLSLWLWGLPSRGLRGTPFSVSCMIQGPPPRFSPGDPAEPVQLLSRS